MRDWAEDKITFVMIRHGETKSNKEHRYLGRTEESLSDEGIEKLKEYRRLNSYPPVDMLFASPMKRCRETAKILYPGLTPVYIGKWKEMDFGAFEGKTYAELQKDWRYQRWIDSNGQLPFPGGESREGFVRRNVEGFRQMYRKIRQEEREASANRRRAHDRKCGEGESKTNTVGMIVHGGTIMALLGRFAGGDYFDYQTENGKGYICVWESRDSKLELAVQKKI